MSIGAAQEGGVDHPVEMQVVDIESAARDGDRRLGTGQVGRRCARGTWACVLAASDIAALAHGKSCGFNRIHDGMIAGAAQ